jgi:flagellar motor switch protein FliN/FliY
MTQDEINELLNQGATVESPSPAEMSEEKVEVQSADFESFSARTGGEGKHDNKLEMLMDLSLPIAIELGRTNMFIKDILELGRGSIVEFDKLASEPVDVLINGKKMAEGEVVVIDKHFGIHITSLIDPTERIKGLRK